MRLGIIGLVGAGKTTVFNALTGGDLPVGVPSHGAQLHSATVDIPDRRLRALSDLYQPKKTTHAKVTFSDLGGLHGEAGRTELSGELLNTLTQMDAFLLVLRDFEDPLGEAPPDPARDLAALEAEFLLRDLLRVEAWSERLAEERQKGARDKSAIEREVALLERLAEALQVERPLRQLQLTPEEEGLLAGWGLLSRKPLLPVINLAEDASQPSHPIPPPALYLWGKLEMELAQLADDEAQAFRQEYGIAEPALQRAVQLAQSAVGRLIFYTVSEPEVRAWLLPGGGSAWDAAGTIHTDMARGFIRAEVIGWEDLIALGGLGQARSQGKLRVEGKDYRLSDGEVIYIRFQV